MANFGGTSGRFWRPVIVVIVSYAIALQSLFIGFAGLPQTTNAGEGLPVFELCLHGAQNAPGSPAGAPGHVSGGHCIFCYAGSHLSLGGSPPSLFHRVDIEIGNIGRPQDNRRVSILSKYSIALPRGPPLSA